MECRVQQEYKKMAVLKLIVDFENIDWSWYARTPCGRRDEAAEKVFSVP